MKTYNLSKEDLEYLRPLEAVRQALDSEIKIYLRTVFCPRVGIKPEQRIIYNLSEGTIEVSEIEVATKMPEKKK